MDEQFQMLFDNMKMEIKNQTIELTETITKTIMSRLEEKLKPITEENRLLKTKLENMQEEMDHLKWEKRSKNIVIFGLKEVENSTSELLMKVKEVFQHDARIVIEEYDVNNLYRIGKANRNDKPRPILFSFELIAFTFLGIKCADSELIMFESLVHSRVNLQQDNLP
ncbi:unnamed protein product [Arctia plantaginis]|uniref:Uncharacterized protein n=1 Tax=Arctia plantaginis TaxID=874455 RepID=A0A8S1ACZ6_ARCPL|nr:unnamed protein product [Arctia plantaginis]